MASKFIALLACISFASAGTLPAAGVYYSAPQALAKAAPLAVAQPVLAKADDQYDPNPQYNFAYDVQDSLSGDSHSQFESRDGDVVQGQYSLVDADGYKRTVEYTADPLHGFNAVVSREPLGVAAKSVAAPGLVKSAPVAYYQHQPQLIRAAPLAHVAAPAAFLSHQPLAYAHH